MGDDDADLRYETLDFSTNALDDEPVLRYILKGWGNTDIFGHARSGVSIDYGPYVIRQRGSFDAGLAAFQQDCAEANKWLSLRVLAWKSCGFNLVYNPRLHDPKTQEELPLEKKNFAHVDARYPRNQSKRLQAISTFLAYLEKNEISV